MFNECLEIRWKTAHFCILPLKLFFLRSSINHETHVSSPDETPRSSSKIHCCVSYFQLSSQYFIWWWNTTSHSWYITSNTTVSRPNTQAWENSRRTGFPPKWRLRHKRRNSILMTCHNLDLVSTCDWLCRVGDLHQTNQKHYQDLGSNTSSVWNFCARFSDVISRGNQWWRREMSSVFAGYIKHLGEWS